MQLEDDLSCFTFVFLSHRVDSFHVRSVLAGEQVTGEEFAEDVFVCNVQGGELSPVETS